MDKITKSFVDSFINKYGFNISLPESDKFEYFSIFSILSKEVNGIIQKDEIETVSTGKAKGVDGIAFCINGKLILNSDEIDNFDDQSIIVDLYFFQSKTSPSFNDTELSNFLDVTIDFFSDTPTYIIKKFDNSKDIYAKLLTKLSNVREMNIHCFYISLGQQQDS